MIMTTLHKSTNVQSFHGSWGGASGVLIIHYNANKKGSVGFIEEIWTEPKQRHQGHATKLIHMLLDLAKKEGCYKTVLMCRDELVPMYEKMGFRVEQNAMRIDL